jgi:hypothetical protein
VSLAGGSVGAIALLRASIACPHLLDARLVLPGHFLKLHDLIVKVARGALRFRANARHPRAERDQCVGDSTQGAQQLHHLQSANRVDQLSLGSHRIDFVSQLSDVVLRREARRSGKHGECRNRRRSRRSTACHLQPPARISNSARLLSA